MKRLITLAILLLFSSSSSAYTFYLDKFYVTKGAYDDAPVYVDNFDDGIAPSTSNSTAPDFED